MNQLKEGKKEITKELNEWWKLLTSEFIPKDEVWFFNENNFKFKRPRKLPKYTFKLFGRMIKIYIENR